MSSNDKVYTNDVDVELGVTPETIPMLAYICESNKRENLAISPNQQTEQKDLKVTSLENAYKNDDFESFEKFLKKTYRAEKVQFFSLVKLKTRTQIFDKMPKARLSLFEDILSSNERKSSKYISLILMFYGLWKNEVFIKKVNEQNQTPMFYVLKSNDVESVLSYLMPDWFYPESTNCQTYALVEKSRQFEALEGLKLLEVLYDIINDESELMFREVCLRLIYQFLYECETLLKTEDMSVEDLENEMCIEKAFRIDNNEYRVKVLQILMVYSKYETSCPAFEERILSYVDSDESKTFFKMIFLLKQRQIVRFQINFEKFLKEKRNTMGDFFKVALKHQVRLLFTITSRQRMFRTCEFIFQKFPFIGVNSTIMTSFLDNQDFKVILIHPLRNKLMNRLVKYYWITFWN